MPYPRPKILTRVTVPTGGWAWDIDLSNVAQYDTNITGTVPAGDYYIAGDNQSDDLLFALQTAIQAGIDGTAITGDVCIDIHPTSHKVRFQFYGTGFVDATGDNDVRIDWPASAAGLYQALGFDGSAQDALTIIDNPYFVADWHHAYGWYADEDGQLADLMAADKSITNTIQGTTISGKVKSQFFGERFANSLSLQQIERDTDDRTKVQSNGIGYGAAPVHPYNRNEPLECWWEEARKGVEFRVYEYARVDAGQAADLGTSTVCDTTTLADGGKSWAVEPYRWVGRLIYIPTYAPLLNQMFYIASHSATILTVANAHPSGDDVDGGVGGAASGAYYILDHPYNTYVLDTKKMAEFAPQGIPKIDRYNITIPLKRYIA